MMTRDKMITRLKGKISATRLTHSFGVEYTAACLAMVHGEDAVSYTHLRAHET